VESDVVDILAHPGLLTLEDARLAAARDCYVEITTRQGHCLTNGHVAKVCGLAGAKMVVNSDAHVPSDLVSLAFAQQVAAGAGLAEAAVFAATVTNPQELVSCILMGRQS
jgi:histidinol phosphatase-like PHP family hydrolase